MSGEKYAGEYSKGMLPKNYLYKRLVRIEQRGSRTIEWYDVWVKDPDAVPHVFREDEEPKRDKIRRLTREITGRKI